MSSTANSYRHAKRVASRSGSSFTAAFSLLPNAQRQGMLALYAFARITDDLGDPPRNDNAADRLPLLQFWLDSTSAALAGTPYDQLFAKASPRLHIDPADQSLIASGICVMPALFDTVRRFRIAPELLFELIEGVMIDQRQNRFETLEMLENYCYHVAATVGIACISIWGYQPPMPRDAAIACGLAFQLTNILRDISEDSARNRIYLPREIWQSHNVSETEVLNGLPTPGMLATIDQMGRIAEHHFINGWDVHKQLPTHGQRMFSLIWRTYRTLLDTIRSHPAASLQQRTRLSFGQKACLLASHRFQSLYERLKSPVEH